MAYRNRYLSTRLSEADWQNVIDIANVWGETPSTAAMKLIERGIEEIEKEMGSATPLRVRIHRLQETVKQRKNLRQELQDTLNMIREEKCDNQEGLIAQVVALADQANINLT